MATLRTIADKFVNIVAGLGTPRDKAAGSTYAFTPLSDATLSDAYRSAWLPRKIVDVPALDACRKWRNWQADSTDITKIEAEENRLDLRIKLLDAFTKARLFGGAGIFIGTGEEDTSAPLNVETVKRIEYLTVMPRSQLQAGELEKDPLSPWYGKPKEYQISGAQRQVAIHPSRLVILSGVSVPDDQFAGGNVGWGDSVLQSIYEAIQNADSTLANIASLVFEAKVDVFGIEGFNNNLANGGTEYENLVLRRFGLVAMTKGNNGAILIDKDDEYSQKTQSFAGLPDISDRMLQVASGAADIPLTRLLGQSPGGLNSTGESDLRNYYDRIQSMQELQLTPALHTLDECLIRSALGTRPPDVFYNWASLWQTTSKERADIGKVSAETIKTLADTGLYAPDALSKASVNMLTELGVMPGLEAAVEEFKMTDPDGEEDDAKDPPVIGDASPRTLYVHRKVTNAAEIIKWAKAQGFETTLPADDMHVTIAYSKQPVDWMKAGADWTSREDGGLTVRPGGARLIEKFDGGAIVLLFNSSDLAWRHHSILEAGATWDWPEYQPHITISYADGMDIAAVEPYRGTIELGPEVFEELDENWRNRVSEE